MILKPTRQRYSKKKIYAFDIETYDNNKGFLLGTIYGKDVKEVFYSREEMRKFFRKKMFEGALIVATNLGFDFSALYYGTDDIEDFNMLFRGSDLITAYAYKEGGRFYKKGIKHRDKVTFLDTLNFAKLSVEKAGKIVDIPKMVKPKRLGKKPKTKEEWKYLREYCMRDSEVSYKLMEFLRDSFEDLGASLKMTIASTAMSLYKNRYLEGIYKRHEIPVLKELFKAYYGGRTECFKRGGFRDHLYYDVNSLYPYSMINDFPDPNSIRHNKKDTLYYIEGFHGISEVDIYCPDMEYPVLPVKYNNKLIFPVGTFHGHYTNIELRYARDNGYIIKKVYQNFYFKKTCRPFDSYVKDLYDKRKELKAKGDPMEYVVKILMNSLYGKFGQKFEGRDNLEPFNHTLEELQALKSFERVGKYIRTVKDCMPSSFCIPEWASYVTSYARIHLHRLIKISDPVYCDTDSIITTKDMRTSDELGDLKLEFFVKKGIIVKPKFYCIDGRVKIKGIGKKIDIDEFLKLLSDPNVAYQKLMKIRESVRRGFIPNEAVDVRKQLSLEDNKRIWEGIFSEKELKGSRPIILIDGMTGRDRKELYIKAMDSYKDDRKGLMENIDAYDSKGYDITDEEFIENESFYKEYR